jgi:acyl carrier protein
MNKSLLLDDLAELFEIDVKQLTNDYPLKNNLLWDSLSVVSTIASVDQHHNVVVKGLELENCKNIEDLFNLVQGKLENKNNIVSFG